MSIVFRQSLVLPLPLPLPCIHSLCSPPSNPRLLSSEELDERFSTQQAAIREYRAKRQEILRGREGERKERNEAKKRQLEWAQQLQVRDLCHYRLPLLP